MIDLLPRRHVWTSPDTLVPELTMFGWGNHRAGAPQGLPSHVHPDAYELCWIKRGSVDWWAGRETHRVGRGDLYLTRPGELHGGVDALLHPCELYWLQLRLPLRRLNARQNRALAQRLDQLRFRCFAGSALAHQCFAQMHLELRGAGDPTVLRLWLEMLTVHLLRDHDEAVRLGRASAKALSQRTRAALAWIESRLEEDFTIEQAAAAVGLRASRLHELFVLEVGQSPGAYRTRLRVERAKRWLKETREPVTRIALRLGFGTSQYFATVFKGLTGLSPRAYRSRASNLQGTSL